MPLLLCMVETEVQPVARRQTVVVARRRIILGTHLTVGVINLGLTLWDGHSATAGIGPGGTEREFLAELVIHDERQVVPAVVAVGEGLSSVYHAVRENAVAPCEGVSQPAGGGPGLLLNKEFHSAGTAFPHLHIVLPVRGIAEEGGAVAVFQDIMHPLVVALQRELPSGDAVVVGPERHLVGGNGLYLVGDRHPEVDGQGNLRRREQMYVLRHTRVGGLGGPVS